MEKTLSVINWVKDYDDKYVATLPINTIEEVYYDIDNGIKLKDVLKQVVQYIQVSSTADLYKLTPDDVVLGAIVRVKDTGICYRVIDLDKLYLPEGYEIANGPNIVLPDDEPPIEIIAYTSNDLTNNETTETDNL